jgi:hypothetical protein
MNAAAKSDHHGDRDSKHCGHVEKSGNHHCKDKTQHHAMHNDAGSDAPA